MNAKSFRASAGVAAVFAATALVPPGVAGVRATTGALADLSNITLPDARQNLLMLPSVTDYGARGDVKTKTCSLTVSGSSLTCSGAGFKASDVGKYIEIEGAGTVSNNNGVTAIADMVESGAGYTGVPTCSVNGAGGSGATCQANMKVLSATVNTVGTCQAADGQYTVAINGGNGDSAELTVTIAANTVASIDAVVSSGSYTALPAVGNAGILGGGCNGATATLAFGVGSIDINAAGNNYPAGGTSVSLSGGGGSGAVAGAVTVDDVAAKHATTIAAVGGGGNLTLADPAPHALTGSPGKRVSWGTDSSAAFTAALAGGGAVWVPDPKQDPDRAPTGLYFVGDVAMPSNSGLFGGASTGFDTRRWFGTGSSAPPLPVLVGKSGATNILNPVGAVGVRIEGLMLDGQDRGPNCIAANDVNSGGMRINLTLVTALWCNYGLGTNGKYTWSARIIDSVFSQNNWGIGSLIDSKMFGGALTTNLNAGVFLSNGAAANEFVGVRYQWNYGYGFTCFDCFRNQIIGGNFDRNYQAAINLNGTGRCNEITISGTSFSRNARYNRVGSSGYRSNVAIPNCSDVAVRPGASKIGPDDAPGLGAITPAYFVDIGSNSDRVTVEGANAVINNGVVVGLMAGTVPSAYRQAGNLGSADLINTGYPKFGGQFASSGLGNLGAVYLSQVAPQTLNGSGGSGGGTLTWPGFTASSRNLMLFLKVNGRQASSGTLLNALIPVSISRGTGNSCAVTIGTSVAGFASGPTITASGGGGTITLAVSNAIKDCSKFDLTATNNDANAMNDFTMTLLPL
jgi:hypothetical protein